MSKKEEKDIDTKIEDLLKEYAEQNKALEKILEKIIPNKETEDKNNEENEF